MSVLAVCLSATAVSAQQGAMRPGEAYLTRFSGVAPSANGPVIDVGGTVGSIIDIRAPSRPPQGEHWADEPQRRPVTAGEVGQVFGVVLDDSNPPAVYLSATSAFGLHLQPGTSQWMQGMWGRGAGPGTIWRLDPANGYRPQPFADVTLNGRANTGAALGNMAFDKATRQLFVSDLETGMIHRIDASSGADLGTWDHGSMGRPNFVDAETGKAGNLPPIAFDPGSRAKIGDCPSGFERTPECWNLAPSGRRVWGIGLRREPGKSDRRLYYAVWAGPGGAQSGWESAQDEDKRSAVWSVGIGPDGGFDGSDVRREFLIPDFFTEAKDVARAGFSRPVSDISFAECTSKPVMLIAERGGHRNLGLGAEDAFATPHESRTLRYEMDQTGKWQPVGRYDIGFYDRKKEGNPFLRANCAGGVAFGYGYNTENTAIDTNAPGEYVWITGDSLCSADAPCRAPNVQAAQGAAQNASAQDTGADGSEVHGLQGMTEAAVDALVPDAAYAPYPQTGEPTPASGPDQSYLIDADINVDASGKGIDVEFTRNDATRIGDVAIFAVCNPPPPVRTVDLLPPQPVAPPIDQPVVEYEGHDRVLTHATIASHGARSSHFRIASHNPWWSHDRIRSHNRWRSHDVLMSRPVHRPVGSWHRLDISWHRPAGSLHFPRGSFHRPIGSWHQPIGSVHMPRGSWHRPPGSIHVPRGSIHVPQGSIHLPRGSIHRPPGSVHLPHGSIHRPQGSIDIHRPIGSNVHRPIGSTNVHRPIGSTNVHRPIGSTNVHRPIGSTNVHRPIGSHDVHRPIGSTNVHRPVGSTNVHRPVGSTNVHRPPGSSGLIHRPAGSKGSVNVHRPVGSRVVHRPAGSKSSVNVHRPVGSRVVHRPAGSKSSVNVHRPVGSRSVHRPAGSKSSVNVHRPVGSRSVHRPAGSRSTAVHRPAGSRSTANVHRPAGSRSTTNVHRPAGSRSSVNVHRPAGSKSTTRTPHKPIPR